MISCGMGYDLLASVRGVMAAWRDFQLAMASAVRKGVLCSSGMTTQEVKLTNWLQ